VLGPSGSGQRRSTPKSTEATLWDWHYRIFAVVFVGIFGLNPAVVAAPEAAKSTLVDASWEAYQAGDYESAANGFKHLARMGIIKMQTNLGYMYPVGKGVKADLVQSALWFRMAAEQGHAGAQKLRWVLLLQRRGRGEGHRYRTCPVHPSS
jgi:TPR repeat protein